MSRLLGLLCHHYVASISGAQAAAPAVGISQPGGRGKESEGNVGAIVFYGQNLKRSLPVTLPART